MTWTNSNPQTLNLAGFLRQTKSLICFLLLFGCPMAGFGQLPSVLWVPKPAPQGIQNARAHLLVLDASKSMLKNNLFGASAQQICDYIDQAEPGTYCIVATFGTTADVKADAFLAGSESRETLKTQVRQLQAIYTSTNFEEAAKLIRSVQLELEQHLTVPGKLAVTVLSDEIPEASEGKSNTPLRALLDEIITQNKLDLVEIRLLPEGEAATSSAVGGSTTDKTQVSASVDGISKELQLRGSKSSNKDPKGESGISDPPNKEPIQPPVSWPWWYYVLGLGAVGILIGVPLFFAFRKKEAGEAEGQPDSSPQTEPVPEPEPDQILFESPSTLLIEECVLIENQRRKLQEVDIPIDSGIEVPVGTDQTRCLFRATPIDGIEPGFWFSLRISSGHITIRPAFEGMSCGTPPVPIPLEGIERPVSANRPLKIRFHNREWIVKPVVSTSAEVELLNLIEPRL